MPRGTHVFDFSRYEDKVVTSINYVYNAEYEEIHIEFKDGDILEIYSEDLQFEHTTLKREDSRVL